MKTNHLNENDLALIERACVPVAVCRFDDVSAVPLALSAGFAELFGFESPAQAYDAMERDIYCGVHPDDRTRVADAVACLAAADKPCDVVYRCYVHGKYRVIHAFGRQELSRTGERLGVCWYADEGLAGAEHDRERRDVISYAHIARALSKDYIKLYYVDLETDSFIEYSSHSYADDLAVDRRSLDFFGLARCDALTAVYPEDQPRFLEVFTKEHVMNALETHGVFTLNYRLMTESGPTYVSMKAARMEDDPLHLIFGISSVDAQMRHQEAMERMKEERITAARIAALSGDFIAIYSVDPDTGIYAEYSATSDYEGLGLAKQGDDFFASARSDAARMLYLEDLDLYLSVMTKENVLDTIARSGVFSLTYRLMINGTPTYVSLKAGMIEEKDGPQLIVGVININDQVKRDQEYAHNLSVERDKANYDALTGVKNKHAYIDVEARLNRQIEEGERVEFALVVCDVNDLKQVNDTYGHQAGDRFLQKARTVICGIFPNSPVFRVGGDEFAVIIQGQDYAQIDAQTAAFDEVNRRNAETGDITIAFGMARYEGDRSVASVFERADALMYQNKRAMQNEEIR